MPAPDEDEATVFVSVAPEDADLLGPLSSALPAAITVDFDSVLDGRAWRREILDRIRDCDAFVVVLSRRWADDAARRVQWGYARALGKPVLAVRFAADEMTTATLGDTDIADVPDSGPADGWVAALEALIRQNVSREPEVAASVSAVRAKPRRRRSTIALLLCLTILLVGAGVAVSVRLGSGPISTPAANVTAAQLLHMLPTPRQVDAVLNVTDMRVTSNVDYMNGAVATPDAPNCLGLIETRAALAYEDFDDSDVLGQTLASRNRGSSVIQAVVRFDSPAKAIALVDESFGTWTQCAGQTITGASSSGETKWAVSHDVTRDGARLVASMTDSENRYWTCQHALSVAVNVVYDVEACGPGIVDEAARLADIVQDRVGRLPPSGSLQTRGRNVTGILSTPQQLAAAGIEGTPYGDAYEGLSIETQWVSESVCAGVFDTASWATYADGDYVEAAQRSWETRDGYLDEAAVRFGSATAASDFFDRTSGVWQGCSGDLELYANGGYVTWKVDPPSTDSTGLSQLASDTTNVGTVCRHDMKLVSDVVVEARVCGTADSDWATQSTRQMAANALR